MDKKLCLIIPCYNEEKRLLVAQYATFLEKKRCDLLFVNDGSKDGTAGVLQELSGKYENALVLNLSKNKGKAEAVREGILHALSLDKNYTYLGFWDADLATSLDEIEVFLSLLKIKNYDCIIGSRVRRLGALIKRKWHRHYLGRIFATVASWMLKISVYDTQCGAKLFHRNAVKSIFEKKFVSYWPFDVELFFRLKKNGFNNLYELPLTRWEDVKGSKLSLLAFVKMPFELFRIWIYYR